MKSIVDRFSIQSSSYARYRPHYPTQLYEYLASKVKNTERAWDCGTGNGQVAVELAQRFELVCGTDVSRAQLHNAVQRDNLSYLLSRAERTGFADRTFDLITVAQAIHWFDFDAFYKEVKRVGRPNGIVAVWGYGLLQIAPDIDVQVRDFYTNIVGAFWDAQRVYINHSYRTIPFPLSEIAVPQFRMSVHWTLEDVLGYLNTWSAVQRYKSKIGKNPVDAFKQKLEPLWKSEERLEINFPLFVRIGEIRPT